MDFNKYSKSSRFGLLKFEFYSVIVSYILHSLMISFLATVFAWFTNPELVYGFSVLIVVVVISYYIMRLKLKNVQFFLIKRLFRRPSVRLLEN